MKATSTWFANDLLDRPRDDPRSRAKHWRDKAADHTDLELKRLLLQQAEQIETQIESHS